MPRAARKKFSNLHILTILSADFCVSERRLIFIGCPPSPMFTPLLYTFFWSTNGKTPCYLVSTDPRPIYPLYPTSPPPSSPPQSQPNSSHLPNTTINWYQPLTTPQSPAQPLHIHTTTDKHCHRRPQIYIIRSSYIYYTIRLHTRTPDRPHQDPPPFKDRIFLLSLNPMTASVSRS